MATNRVWALHGNVQNAINYIVNEEKTNEGLTECKGGLIGSAGIEWKTRRYLKKETLPSSEEIVGFHFQMSFEEGSIEYEEAFEIGKEWIESITGGHHDYVMAVHTDTPNAHVHFIVNPINNVTGNQMQIFYKRDLPIFKEISNRICVEHGKRVLENPKGKGRTYYEWLMANQGDTLKQVIAKTLDNVIDKVQSYDDLKTYLMKLGYEIEDGLDEGGNDSTLEAQSYFDEYKFSAHKSLFVKEKETEDSYFVRIPNTKGKEYMKLSKDNGEWTSNQDVFFSSISLSDQFDIFNKEGETISKISASEIKNKWDNKNEKKKGREGLRIKPPHARKFIRCHNIEENEHGMGYGLNDVLDRIENNGRLRTDDKISEVIHKDVLEKSEVNDKLNHLYEDANIRTQWKNSKYYSMSKKERYVAYKTKILQERLNHIHQIREGVDDIHIIDHLKEDRKTLRNDLSSVSKELSIQEAYYEEIYMDMLADRLEVTQSELDDFVMEQIKPLQKQRLKLKDEIASLSKRINIAQTKIENQERREGR